MTPEPLPPLPIHEADPKPWYLSRGVVGALMVIVAQVASAAGFYLDASAATDLVLQLATVIGGVLALIGRLHAQQPIAGR